MLNAAELLSMQQVTDITKITSCQISRVARTSDGLGGTVDVWSVISTPPCRVVQYKRLDYEQFIEGRMMLRNRFVISVPAATDVTEKDRIIALGLTFEVSSVQGPASYEIERSVLCYEVH